MIVIQWIKNQLTWSWAEAGFCTWGSNWGVWDWTLKIKTIKEAYCHCVSLNTVDRYFRCVPYYLRKDIERVQKRALHVVSPVYTYYDDLSGLNLSSLWVFFMICVAYLTSYTTSYCFIDTNPINNLKRPRTFF